MSVNWSYKSEGNAIELAPFNGGAARHYEQDGEDLSYDIMTNNMEHSAYRSDSPALYSLPDKTSKKGSSEMVLDEILLNKKREVYGIYNLLNYDNEAVLEIANDILTNCIRVGKNDMKISRTGENEILIFSEDSGTFKNIIIDKDGDIEFLCIPPDRAKTYNEYYPFIGDIDAAKLAAKL